MVDGRISDLEEVLPLEEFRLHDIRPYPIPLSHSPFSLFGQGDPTVIEELPSPRLLFI